MLSKFDRYNKTVFLFHVLPAKGIRTCRKKIATINDVLPDFFRFPFLIVF